jgi:hypothetical protein
VAVASLDGKIVLYPLDDGAPRTVQKLADGVARKVAAGCIVPPLPSKNEQLYDTSATA